MNKISLLVIVLLFSTGYLKAQEVPKNVNTIILSTAYNSPDVSITDIAHILLDNNYVIDNINRDLSFIVAGPIQYKSVNIKVTFRAVMRENIVTIVCSGIYGDGGSYYYDPILNQSQIWNSIANTKKKLGADKVAWAGFEKIIDLIPHSKKIYETREYNKPTVPWK